MNTDLLRHLEDLRACCEARDWAAGQPDAATAWATCERGDWLLWYVGRTAAGEPWSEEWKLLVRAICECARLALPNVPEGEARPRLAIETAEAWTRGEATEEEVRATSYVAYAAAEAAYDAAFDVAYDASYAGEAAEAAAIAAEAAAEARQQVLARCADIVRRHYTITATGEIRPVAVDKHHN
jgi:hypothetical protein